LLIDLLLVAAGIAVLTLSGDKLVDFAAAIAEKARLTPTVVGLTVVAAGTSAPELFVSVVAAFQESPGIALGNVVGSNIANIALVLGAAALIAPIPIRRRMLGFEFPFMLVASLALPVACLGGTLGRAWGLAFLAGMVVFLVQSVRMARSDGDEIESVAERVPVEVDRLQARPLPLLLLGTAVTIAGLGLGARLLVEGATGAALRLGVSERVVGLTIVAFGTSLPEFVATLAAALKRHHEMAVANIVGSNIFNLLLILGATGVIHPIPVAGELLTHDMPVMILCALALVPLVWRGRVMGRGFGIALLIGYAGYLALLVGKGAPPPV